MEALGRLFDIGLCFAPIDTQSGAITGKRIAVTNASGLTIVVAKGAGVAGDDPTFTLKQHTAYTGGTTANVAQIDHYYVKSETALDNDESWQRISQVAAATVADPGGAGTSAESQQLIVIEVDLRKLDDGYTHVSLDVADTGAGGAQLAAGIYILQSRVMRTPSELGNMLNPGAANA